VSCLGGIKETIKPASFSMFCFLIEGGQGGSHFQDQRMLKRFSGRTILAPNICSYLISEIWIDTGAWFDINLKTKRNSDRYVCLGDRYFVHGKVFLWHTDCHSLTFCTKADRKYLSWLLFISIDFPVHLNSFNLIRPIGRVVLDILTRIIEQLHWSGLLPRVNCFPLFAKFSHI